MVNIPVIFFVSRPVGCGVYGLQSVCGCSRARISLLLDKNVDGGVDGGVDGVDGEEGGRGGR